jgi:hypothetical protein
MEFEFDSMDAASATHAKVLCILARAMVAFWQLEGVAMPMNNAHISGEVAIC